MLLLLYGCDRVGEADLGGLIRQEERLGLRLMPFRIRRERREIVWPEAVFAEATTRGGPHRRRDVATLAEVSSLLACAV